MVVKTPVVTHILKLGFNQVGVIQGLYETRYVAGHRRPTLSFGERKRGFVVIIEQTGEIALLVKILVGYNENKMSARFYQVPPFF